MGLTVAGLSGPHRRHAILLVPGETEAELNDVRRPAVEAPRHEVHVGSERKVLSNAGIVAESEHRTSSDLAFAPESIDFRLEACQTQPALEVEATRFRRIEIRDRAQVAIGQGRDVLGLVPSVAFDAEQEAWVDRAAELEAAAPGRLP